MAKAALVFMPPQKVTQRKEPSKGKGQNPSKVPKISMAELDHMPFLRQVQVPEAIMLGRRWNYLHWITQVEPELVPRRVQLLSPTSD